MLHKPMLKHLLLFNLSLFVFSSIYGQDSRAPLNSELQNSPYIPYNIGADDTQGPDELERVNHPYDPNPYYYNQNEDYDE